MTGLMGTWLVGKSIYARLSGWVGGWVNGRGAEGSGAEGRDGDGGGGGGGVTIRL